VEHLPEGSKGSSAPPGVVPVGISLSHLKNDLRNGIAYSCNSTTVIKYSRVETTSNKFSAQAQKS